MNKPQRRDPRSGEATLAAARQDGFTREVLDSETQLEELSRKIREELKKETTAVGAAAKATSTPEPIEA